MQTRIVKVLALSFPLLSPSMAVLSDEPKHQFIEELEAILEIDFDDDDVVQEAVGELYLQCAAFYNAMSISIADSRPNLSKLHNDTKNWHMAVGMALLAEKGKPIGTMSDYANAYMEAYMLDTVLKFSEADFDVKHRQCSSPSMQQYGSEIMEDLESQLERTD